jgi:hypothetical protein
MPSKGAEDGAVDAAVLGGADAAPLGLGDAPPWQAATRIATLAPNASHVDRFR